MRYKSPLEAEFGSSFCKDNIQNEPPMTEEQWQDSHDAWYQDHHVTIDMMLNRIQQIESILYMCCEALLNTGPKGLKVNTVLHDTVFVSIDTLKQELREYGDKSRDS